MSWTALEVVGLLFCLYFVWNVVSAVCNLLYTCYIGKVLGRAIDVKKLGPWAGKKTLLVIYSILLFLCWLGIDLLSAFLPVKKKINDGHYRYIAGNEKQIE